MYTGVTACADQEFDMPTCPDTDDMNQIWYQYTAPADLLFIDLSIQSTGNADLAVDFGQLTNCDPLDFVTTPYVLNAPYCNRDVEDTHICLEEGEISHHTNSFRIKGFERDGKSFGGATAFLAKISVDNENWIECAILIPDLTRHTETAEVISGSFLRESLPCDWLK